MNRARELRKELGLSQVQLARLTGEVQPTIALRESGVQFKRQRTARLAIGFLLYLKTLPRATLDALLADPSSLDN